MVNVFAVVGECRENPGRLLVIDPDGAWYDYRPAQGRFTPVMGDRLWVEYRRLGDQDGVDALPDPGASRGPALARD